MGTRSMALACSIVLLIINIAAVEPHAAGRADNEIRLSGCLVRGVKGGYLLTNMPGEPAWQRSVDATVLPGAVGTTGSFATIFYWLNDRDELKNHIGHQVEVEGDLEGDLRDGEIKIERKPNWTEIRIQSKGRDLKARVPHSSIVAAPGRNERELPVLVRKVDAKRLKMLDASCER